MGGAFPPADRRPTDVAAGDRRVVGDARDSYRLCHVRGHLHELGGDLRAAATAYADAARLAPDVAERDHLVRQAARARAAGGHRETL